MQPGRDEQEDGPAQPAQAGLLHRQEAGGVSQVTECECLDIKIFDVIYPQSEFLRQRRGGGGRGVRLRAGGGPLPRPLLLPRPPLPRGPRRQHQRQALPPPRRHTVSQVR